MTDRGTDAVDAAGGDAAAAGRLRLLLVANPHASTTDDAARRAVATTLARRHRVDEVLTGHRGHAIELSRAAAADGYDAVVALGGDGTVNEVANGLVGTATALAPLPGGATNVYCRMLGMPRRPEDAAERLAAEPRLVVNADMARVNDRWFTFAAGVGLDASVVERVDRRPAAKARWGRWFFAGVALSVFLRRYVRDPVRMQVETADRSFSAVTVLMQNGNPYTYFGSRPIVLSAAGGLFSGDLGGIALTRATARDVVPGLWRALSRQPVAGHPAVEPLSAGDGLVVRSLDSRPLPVQVDGDHIGEHLEVRFSLSRGALRVLGAGAQPPPGVTR